MTRMHRFICFRPTPPAEYVEKGLASPANEAQFEGVLFTDGTCVIRWRTDFKSHSTWDSFYTLYKVHGHPEYGTKIVWIDFPQDLLGYCEEWNEGIAHEDHMFEGTNTVNMCPGYSKAYA